MVALKPARGFDFTLAFAGYEIHAATLRFGPLPDVRNGIGLILDDAIPLPAGDHAEELGWLVVETGIGEELAGRLRHIEFQLRVQGLPERPITELAEYVSGLE